MGDVRVGVVRGEKCEWWEMRGVGNGYEGRRCEG